MTTARKKIFTALLCVMLILAAVCVLAACNDDTDVKATFKIREAGGDWKQYGDPVTASEGKVILPQAPDIYGYTFRGWYIDEAFTKPFDENSVEKSLTVYGKMVEIMVGVTLNGTSQGSKAVVSLNALEESYSAQAAQRNLVFDGWYTDSGYLTKYTVDMDATDLFARFMAEVKFDNGYETVKTVLVEPDTKMSVPSAESIATRYMSTEDLSFAATDENGDIQLDAAGSVVKFDFSQNISGNTVIPVIWKTPYAKYEKLANGDLAFVGLQGNIEEWKSFPVLSVISDITYEGEPAKVVAMRFSEVAFMTSLQKIIIGEGLQYASYINGGTTSFVKEVSLPSSLKIILGAFNGMTSLEGIELPDGLEVIIDSFWRDNVVTGLGERTATYDFEINLPASVNNMSLVPQNVFNFAEGSSFYNGEDGALYQTIDGKKVLITDREVGENGKLTVAEGVNGIQVGAFYALDVDYISLPSTWSFINYNANINDYEAVYYREMNGVGDKYLNDPQYTQPGVSPVNYLAPPAYSIYSDLEDIQYIAINQTAFPSEISSYALVGTDTGYKAYDDVAAFKQKVVFVGAIDSGEPLTVTVRAINNSTAEITSATIQTTSGQTISRSAVLEAVQVYENPADGTVKCLVEAIRQFGEEYVFDVSLGSHQYIDVEYSYDVTGFTTKENPDGTLSVKSYDQSTAYMLEGNVYLVVIPEAIDGKAVTSIEAGAFKNVNNIGKVIIPASVKSIGDEAFMNTSNLVEVMIVPGGLETIGRSAFENCAMTDIKLPLANLKEVGPYAFKSDKLTKFTAIDSEVNRVIYTINYGGTATKINENLTVGEYYYYDTASLMLTGKYLGILKYTGKTEDVEIPLYLNGENETPAQTQSVDVYDVQLVAIAGGYDGSGAMGLGYSYRKNAFFGAGDTVLRYEIMEGSVYYLGKAFGNGITFGVVSRIHKNAFTDMDEKYSEVYDSSQGGKTSHIKVYQVTPENGAQSIYFQYDKWLEQEQITSVGNYDYVFATENDAVTYDGWKVTSPIFEDGWWEGMMKADFTKEQYEAAMEFMSLAWIDSSILGW